MDQYAVHKISQQSLAQATAVNEKKQTLIQAELILSNFIRTQKHCFYIPVKPERLNLVHSAFEKARNNLGLNLHVSIHIQRWRTKKKKRIEETRLVLLKETQRHV